MNYRRIYPWVMLVSCGVGLRLGVAVASINKPSSIAISEMLTVTPLCGIILLIAGAKLTQRMLGRDMNNLWIDGHRETEEIE